MLNNYQLNSTPLDTNPLTITATQDVIAFNGYGLQNASVITTSIDYDDSRWMDLKAFDYPQDDGGATISRYYRGREIRAKITLRADTAAEFSALLDDFKKNVRGVDGNLDIKVQDETRRIKATVTAVDFGRQHYNITFAVAEVTFKTSEPFFYAVSAQSFEFLAQTATFNGEFTNGGSTESDPKAYLIFGAWSATTAVTLSAFGRSLTIATSFAANDILIIDCAGKTVTKNGTEIDYTGQFPIMPPGSCPFTVGFTGTTLCDVTVTVPKNYL